MADNHGPQSRAETGQRIATAAVCLTSLIAMVLVGGIFLRRYQKQQTEPDRLTADARPLESGAAFSGPARSLNSFELGNASVPREEILRGGPPKDGIPALTDPKLRTARELAYPKPQDRIVGVVFNGVARAYPLAILNQHEIVNDTVGNQPVAITYCPLCDSALAFDRRNGDQIREFGVSGLLYSNNVLMYDRGETQSLWSQMMRRSVAGAVVDQQLTMLPLELTTWERWRERYPDTQVLSRETGFDRNYKMSPYRAYFASEELMFPMKRLSDTLPTKTPVLGVIVDEQARAYPVTAFNEQHQNVADQLGGKKFEIAYDAKANSLRVVQADQGLQWAYAFWFAWYGFHPETEVYAP